MTSRFIKVPTLTGVADVTNQKLLDFDMLDYASFDPSKSYLSLLSTLETTESSGVDGIHCCYVNWKDNANYKNSALISDYFIRNSKLGDIENVLESNVLNMNVSSFNEDFEEVQSRNIFGFNQHRDPIANKFVEEMATPYRRLTQDKDSQNITHEINIKMTDMSALMAQLPVYPGMQLGPTRLQVKFDTSMIDSPKEFLPYETLYSSYLCSNVGANATNTLTISQRVIDPADIELSVDDEIVIKYNDGLNVILSKNNVTAVNANTVTQVSTIQFNNDPVVSNATNISITKLGFTELAEEVTGLDNYVILKTAATNTSLRTKLKQYLGKTILITYENTLNNPEAIVKIVSDVTLSPLNGLQYVKLHFTGTLNIPGNGDSIVSVIPSSSPGFSAVNGTYFSLANTLVKDSGLWVGQKLEVVGLTAAPVKQRLVCKIVSLTQSGANTIVGVDSVSGFQATTNLLFKCQPAATISLRFFQPSIVFKQLNPGNTKLAMLKNMNEFMFNGLSVERAQVVPGTINFNRIFDCDLGSKNIMFLLVNRNNGELMSWTNTVTKYRMKINDIYITNRDISGVDDPIYKDGIIQVAANSNLLQLRNLAQVCEFNPTTKKGLVFMPCAMLDGRYNRVQLSLYFAAPTTQEYVLYAVKEKSRVLSIGKSLSLV